MKRIQLFEFEDFPWLPEAIRSGITNLLAVFDRVQGIDKVVAGLVRKTRSQVDFDRIVDLGSGSGGIMPAVVEDLRGQPDTKTIELILTDLHPHPDIVQSFAERQLPGVSYQAQALDATDLGNAPAGLKTMINSFHHIPPEPASRILRSAQENRTPILIYEMTENFVPTLVWWLLLPLSLVLVFIMALVMMPFTKGLTWQHLVLTYLIPVIPLVYAWDGQASMVRIYTFQDVETLIGDDRPEDYSWEIAKAFKANGKQLGYYILGCPVKTKVN